MAKKPIFGHHTSSYNILSIDGGGLRGIISLAIIERLDVLAPNWRAGIKMYAGTSTGGLIALALAKGLQPKDIMDFYVNKGPQIFDRGLFQKVESVGDFVGAKYSAANMLQAFADVMGTTTRLSELNASVVIPTFDICGNSSIDPAQPRNWKAKIYHNLKTKITVNAPRGTDDGDAYAFMVAMKTSAAPTYFPSYQGHVDGGVFANNPSMCAVAQALDTRLENPQPLTSLKMLSLGTGYFPDPMASDESWGVVEWAPHLVDLLTDGVNDVASFQVQQLLGDRYVRVNPLMPQKIKLDDVSKIGALQQIGNSNLFDLTDAIDLVKDWSS